MPDQQRRLFLSMVSDEFRSYRELLCSDLERGQVEVATQEKWGTLGLTTLKKLDHFIKGCDAVVHVVGDGVGHVPPAKAIDDLLAIYPGFLPHFEGHTDLTREVLGQCSYTQWEAYLAIFHDRRLHIYRAKENAPREDRFVPNDAEIALQTAHFQRIRDLGWDRDVFLNQERLSSFVLADLQDILPARTGDTAEVSATKLTHSARRLIGRETWLAELDAAWTDETCHVVILKAWGGIGKTALTSAWRSEREYKGWREARRVFDWSFYSQGTRDLDAGESAVSADAFIAKALEFFGDPDPTAGSPWDRGERLARLVAAEKSLLILDGIEPLQHPPGPMAGHLTDPALTALLLGLAGRNPGLCLVTTREHVPELDGHRTVTEWELDHLTDDAGAAVLHAQGATRAGAAEIGPDDAELRTASREVDGHALTLTLMGKYLALACEGDIRRRDTFGLAEADPEWVTRFDPHSPYGHAFRVIAAYERWFLDAKAERSDEERRQGGIQLAILRLLGLFNRPASPGCLTALRRAPAIEGLTETLVDLSPRDWTIALSRLKDEALVKRDPTNGTEPALDAHPLVREYFAKQLRETQPESFRAAHSRLFDHLCESTPHRPDSIEGLQPLYQAVSHGCLAGRHEEARADVYIDRILRGTGNDGYYSWRKLGAIGADLGAVAAFFDEPWSLLSPNLSEADQAWLLNEAAFRLRALGRLTEAVEPIGAGMASEIQWQDWSNASISASNLSELEVTLGRLDAAVGDGQRAVEFADQSGDRDRPYFARAAAADARHQHGDRETARALFADAERRQAGDQPTYPLLYSVPGFRYCDLILAPAERAAWQMLERRSSVGAQTIESEGPNQGENSKTSFVVDQSSEETLAPTMGTERTSAAEGGAKRPKRRPPSTPEALKACVEAERRASQTLGWAIANNVDLLTIALDHLTLARAELYATILSAPASASDSTADAPEDRKTEDVKRKTSRALNALREANIAVFLPQALLTAAFCEGVFGDKDQAEAYLREAQQIAERGPMPLYLADVHLHRARLFRDRDELERAKALIEKNEYWRRREELEDAEEAARHW